MAEEHAPGTISNEELTAITGLTDRHLRRLATQGHFPEPAHGRWLAGKTLIGFIKYQAELLRKKNGKLAKEQLALTKAKRQDKQLDYELRQELYVEKSAIGPALRNLSLHQRAVLQRSLEQELGPNLAGLTPIEVVERMKRAVDEICATFREGVAGWLDRPPEEKLPADTICPGGGHDLSAHTEPLQSSPPNCSEQPPQPSVQPS